MPAEMSDALDPFSAFMNPWLGLWRWAAVLGSASLEGIALLWDPRPPSDASLAALTETVDRYLRSAAFLDLMQHGIKLMSLPTRFGFSHSSPRKRALQ
jgi:hypothetical protein